MLDHAIGPNVIKGLLSGMQAFLDKHADKGWHSLDDFRGLRRDRIVAHSRHQAARGEGIPRRARRARRLRRAYNHRVIVTFLSV